MKLGAPKPVVWHETKELNNNFNKTSMRFHKLMILENVWGVLVGKKAKFWVLEGVLFDGKGGKEGALEVSVKNSAALHDLKISEAKLLQDINKYFDKPWLTKIIYK